MQLPELKNISQGLSKKPLAKPYFSRMGLFDRSKSLERQPREFPLIYEANILILPLERYSRDAR